MTSRGQSFSILRSRSAATIASVLACSLLASVAASPQGQSAATAKDVIIARKTLMNSVMEKMDQIGSMISQRKINLPAARGLADDISVMLLAFPHLFPPDSNQWKENGEGDPATETVAAPEIWSDFADFQRRANTATDTAYELSRADNEDDVKRFYRALGIACDTCHSLYFKE